MDPKRDAVKWLLDIQIDRTEKKRMYIWHCTPPHRQLRKIVEFCEKFSTISRGHLSCVVCDELQEEGDHKPHVWRTAVFVGDELSVVNQAADLLHQLQGGHQILRLGNL